MDERKRIVRRRPLPATSYIPELTWQSAGALRPGAMADDNEAEEELKKAKKEKKVRLLALRVLVSG